MPFHALLAILIGSSGPVSWRGSNCVRYTPLKVLASVI